MTVKVVAVGRLQPEYMALQKEFAKRLSRFCRFEIIEVPDCQAPENLSPAEKDSVMLREAQALEKKLTKGDFIIALDSRGDKPVSEALAQKLQEAQTRGHSTLVFVLGGSLGLHASLLERADWCLSLSNMTFTHSLARIVLAEQLYRSFKINSNQPYHK